MGDVFASHQKHPLAEALRTLNGNEDVFMVEIGFSPDASTYRHKQTKLISFTRINGNEEIHDDDMIVVRMFVSVAGTTVHTTLCDENDEWENIRKMKKRRVSSRNRHFL